MDNFSDFFESIDYTALERKTFGSIFYLNSAQTMLIYAKQQEKSFADPVFFVIPCFMTLTSYIDSLFNTWYFEITNAEVMFFNEIQFNKIDLIDRKKFIFLNIEEKFIYLHRVVFIDTLHHYFENHKLEEIFKTAEKDYNKPILNDIRLFPQIFNSLREDRNDLVHPKKKYKENYISFIIPDLFPKTANALGINLDDYSSKNINVVNDIFNKIINLETYFRVGIDFFLKKRVEEHLTKASILEMAEIIRKEIPSTIPNEIANHPALTQEKRSEKISLNVKVIQKTNNEIGIEITSHQKRHSKSYLYLKNFLELIVQMRMSIFISYNALKLFNLSFYDENATISLINKPPFAAKFAYDFIRDDQKIHFIFYGDDKQEILHLMQYVNFVLNKVSTPLLKSTRIALDLFENRCFVK